MIAMSGSRERFAEGLALVESGYALAEKHGLRRRGAAHRPWSRPELPVRRADRQARRVTECVLAGSTRPGQRERLSDLYFAALWMQNAMLVYGGDDVAAAIADAKTTHDLAVRANNRTSAARWPPCSRSCTSCGASTRRPSSGAISSLEIAEAIGNVTTIRTGAAMALGARRELGESVSAERYLRPLRAALRWRAICRSTSGRSSTCCSASARWRSPSRPPASRTSGPGADCARRWRARRSGRCSRPRPRTPRRGRQLLRAGRRGGRGARSAGAGRAREARPRVDRATAR